MRAFVTALMITALPAAAAFAKAPAGQGPLPVGSVTLAAQATVAELETDKLKGEPFRMAWSPDEKEIYLQTVEGPFHQPKAIRHFVITASNGKVKSADGEPAWFNGYWAVRSHKSSPDTPSIEIQLSSENKREKTTSVPQGGDLARGGAVGADVTGTSSGDAIAAAANSQVVTVHTMKLHGRDIGQFTNSVIVPGMTFAWAPAGSKAIVYSEPKGGKLVLMNNEGKRQDLDGTKDALFPMWSSDAKKLAWLQKDGRKKYVLKVAEIR